MNKELAKIFGMAILMAISLAVIVANVAIAYASGQLNTQLAIGIRLRTNPILHPGYAWCHRCCKTWDVVDGHDTPYEWSTPGKMYSLSNGKPISVDATSNPKLFEWLLKSRPTKSCFPLCERCWHQLAPDERLPYYRELVDEWKFFEKTIGPIADEDRAETKWPKIKASVLAGN
jgi:hypothetical protein